MLPIRSPLLKNIFSKLSQFFLISEPAIQFFSVFSWILQPLSQKNILLNDPIKSGFEKPRVKLKKEPDPRENKLAVWD